MEPWRSTGISRKKTSSSRFSSKIDGKEMNENDPGRYVEFGSTGFLTCPLAIKDASSGGVMTSLNESGVCPTNESRHILLLNMGRKRLHWLV